jgi:hypothetical protein
VSLIISIWSSLIGRTSGIANVISTANVITDPDGGANITDPDGGANITDPGT